MLCENLTPEQEQAIRMLLQGFAEGMMPIGGMIRAGFGQISLSDIQVCKITVQNRRFVKDTIPFESFGV
jgi:hypothetical protein